MKSRRATSGSPASSLGRGALFGLLRFVAGAVAGWLVVWSTISAAEVWGADLGAWEWKVELIGAGVCGVLAALFGLRVVELITDVLNDV